MTNDKIDLTKTKIITIFVALLTLFIINALAI